MKITLEDRSVTFVPVGMSLAALMLVVLQVVAHGMQPEADEGAIAHLYQFLVAGQLPVIAYCAFRCLRRSPSIHPRAIVVQLLALATALVPVAWMGW